MLNNFTGKKLVSVYGLYFFEKKPITSKHDLSNIIEITFAFENGILSIKCDDIGIGLKIDNEYQLENVDMLEYGLFHRLNISDINIFRSLVNTCLNNFEKIVSDNYEVGVMLSFDQCSISIFNAGDVLAVN